MSGKTAKPKRLKLGQKRKGKTLQKPTKAKIVKKTAKKKRKRKARADKRFNESAVRDAFMAILVEKKGRPPTAGEIAKRVGLTRQTVQQHVTNLKFEPRKSVWRLMTPDVYAGMLAAARRGSSRCISLWFQIMEGWTPRTDLTSKGKSIVGMIAAPGTPEGDAALGYMSDLHDDQL